VLNQILAHLWQTLNAYKASKLRLLGALRRLSVAFHLLYQNLVLIAFHSFITNEEVPVSLKNLILSLVLGRFIRTLIGRKQIRSLKLELRTYL
jgi:hypothetical protein